ncbi:MAG: ABC transporter permease [Chloroflexi bacterium]|nr:ABC transporter permease [Chloroflexota bacterium]
MTTTTLQQPVPVAERAARNTSLQLVRRILRVRLAPLAVGILGAFLLVAIFANVIQRYDPITDQSYSEANEGPSMAHWLGTDYLGRDMWSRLVHGSRISLFVGLISVGVGLTFGVSIGVAAGFVGGKLDAFLMRITESIWTFPALMLALAITSVLGRGLVPSMIAIGIVGIPYFARLARASTLTARELDYVLAARALGAPTVRILTNHILPNIAAPLIVQASLGLGTAIITEASLSFLGVGVQAPTPSWGLELRTGYQYLEINPAVAIFPGVAIFLTVLAFNFLGDALRTALDPRLARRGGD